MWSDGISWSDYLILYIIIVNRFQYSSAFYLIYVFLLLVKQTNVKLKHDDRDGGSCFFVLKGNEVKTKSMTKVSMSIKAISIQAVSQRMFLILDSHGDLHLLSLSNSGIGVDITGNVRQLPRIMKVWSLAVLPDLSTSKCFFLSCFIFCFSKFNLWLLS